jgi:hypothetical protein
MAYMMVVGKCIACHAMITFNADLVPSVRVGPDGRLSATGHREPVCRTCVNALNEKRAAVGMPLIPIHKEAYEPEEVE